MKQLFLLITLFFVGVPGGFAQERALVIARDMDINSLDPARSWCDTCQIYNSSVYEQLVTLDKNNQVVPLLAERWEVNDAQTRFTFHLNPQAKFADGTPVQAADVKWSFERHKHILGSSAFLVEPITAIHTPDPHTVVIEVASPNSEFLNQVAASYLAIINSKLASAHGALATPGAATRDTSEDWFLRNSAGSGPFVLERYEPNAELRLKRNDNYWRTGVSVVPAVIFRQVKDAVAQAQMLQSGAADIAMQVDPETAKTLRSSRVKVEHVPSYNFVYLGFSPAAKSNTVKLTPAVREAISLAIDRDALIEFTLGGAGRALAAPIPLGFPGGDGHAPPVYDPQRAKVLLHQAGLASGFKLSSIYPDMNIYGVDFSLMMQKIQQDLAKVGIAVSLSPVPMATWREIVISEHIPMTALFYAPDFFGSSQYVDVFGLSKGSVWATRAGADKDPSILNENTTALRDKALAASPDMAEKFWFAAGEAMMQQRIIMPMISPNLILAYRANIRGVRYSVCCNLPLAEISN